MAADSHGKSSLKKKKILWLKSLVAPLNFLRCSCIEIEKGSHPTHLPSLLRSVWTPTSGTWSTATCWSRPRTRLRRRSSRFTRWCRETRTRDTSTPRRTPTCWRASRSLRPSHRPHPTWKRAGFLLGSCPFGPKTGRKWRPLRKKPTTQTWCR